MTRKRAVLISLTGIISLVVTLVLAEGLLHAYRYVVASSDRMDPGLISYDHVIGWRLRPGWRGRHKHFDFNVTYTINNEGFRGEPFNKQNAKTYALLGDSFVFGLGVNDEDTLVSQLNKLSQGKRGAYFNFGVPGYSTDQEYLLFKYHIRSLEPDVLLLVVYLGNDIFDNTLPFPLQALNAKPYFQNAREGELLLKNIPVPARQKDATHLKKSLATLVLPDGQEPKEPPLEVLRLTGLFSSDAVLSDDFFKQRFHDALKLFFRLVQEFKQDCLVSGIDIRLILLAGRSFQDEPGSYSEQYQDFLRRRIKNWAAHSGIPVIDLAESLRENKMEKIFYPHEGHLTAQGNRIAAGALLEALK